MGKTIHMKQTAPNTWHNEGGGTDLHWVIERRAQRKDATVFVVEDLHGDWKVRVDTLEEAVAALEKKSRAKVIMPKATTARVVERFLAR